MGENGFKRAIEAGQVQIGLWSALCSQVATEIALHAGYDFIMFDTEHAPLEVAGLFPLLQAVAGSPSHAAARLAWNDRVLIKRALDIGAQTIMVPFVENAEEAREAVASCAYPPDGRRGVAGGTRATAYGRERDYFERAREDICLLVQVETAGALSRLEEIAAVEGVDGVFIGPADLAASMGHLGNSGHEEVQAALQGAALRLKAVGKPSGILAGSETDARRFRDWGFTFVVAGSDTGLLAGALDARRAALG